MTIQIELANPRGFCAGVDRAIAIVERALAIFGAPIYVRHEVVHNRFVVDGLRDAGAIFVDELDDVPDDSVVIFSAHGVPQSVRREAQRRGLKVFDATCPLVTKVHMEVSRYQDQGMDVVLVGHAGHPEVEGTLGQFEAGAENHIYLVENEQDAEQLVLKDPARAAYTTQTTLSMDDTRQIIEILRRRFPAINGPRKDDICYATQNRQNAVRDLAQRCDLVLVVGSVNSSNSNRLRELAEKTGAQAYLVDGPQDLQQTWLDGISCIGITAGASAPEVLVGEVVEKLREWGAAEAVEGEGKRESVTFSLPKELAAG